MKKIGVIFGGKSVEHDISIITGLQMLKILSRNYECLPIYIDKDGRWLTAKNLQKPSIYMDFSRLAKGVKAVIPLFAQEGFLINRKIVKLDCVFNCCHGVNGEDGTVAAVLELTGVAYSSSGVLSSAVCMDKVLTKMILNQNNITNTPFSFLFRQEFEKNPSLVIERLVKELEYPMIVKPANLGSSVGISVCENDDQLIEAIKTAFNFDNKVLVEKYLDGSREFNCACFIYKDRCFVSNVNEVEKSKIYSFDEKYILEKESTKKELPEEIVGKIKHIAENTYKVLQCFGVVRVDFLYKDNEVYVNEVNSIPGSLACYLYENFEEVLDLVIAQAREREKEKRNISFSYDSQALKVFERLEETIQLKK